MGSEICHVISKLFAPPLLNTKTAYLKYSLSFHANLRNTKPHTLAYMLSLKGRNIRAQGTGLCQLRDSW